MSDRARDAISVEELRRQLSEAHEQQTATADLLRVISTSQFDLQPVFDAVARDAVDLCQADNASIIFWRESGSYRYIANAGDFPDAEAFTAGWEGFQVRPGRGTLTGRLLLERRPVQIEDIDTDPDYEHAGRKAAGTKTHLAVPLLVGDEVIGAIIARRFTVRPFSQRQIVLLETFAAQAVIAIENARLFNETKEALERQTATAEILRVIAGSPDDIAPVLNVIATSARRYCQAEDAAVLLLQDQVLSPLAHDGPLGGQLPGGASGFPLDQDTVSGRSVIQQQTVHVVDLQEAADEFPVGSSQARQGGYHTTAATPLLREGKALGAILLRRADVRPFTAQQLDLLRTFADQAVIAIENVRLFNETKEALEQQTAIGQILEATARSTRDVAPVMQTIAERAALLCEAEDSWVGRYTESGDLLLDAYSGPSEEVRGQIGTVRTLLGRAEGSPSAVPRPLDAAQHAAVWSGDTRHIHNLEDASVDPLMSFSVLRRLAGMRGFLHVPLVKDDQYIGSIALGRSKPGKFTEDQVRLVKTFADQAVIAVENVRLFNETNDALGRQTAMTEILELISRSTADATPVFQAVVERATLLCGADSATLMLRRGEDYRGVAHSGLTSREAEGAYPLGRRPYRPGRESLTGRVLLERRTVHIEDFRTDSDMDPDAKREEKARPGSHAPTMLGVPLLLEDEVIGVLIARRREVRPFHPPEIKLLETFASQAAVAIQNARLFEEIQQKSRQLEVASRHKSEFLANMSHELRTPLNAIIGFTDVMLQEMFGKLNDKQREYLNDVRGSGTHLLTLINDILDLSKIEAGRVELEIAEFSLAEAVEQAVSLVRERAVRHGIRLATEVPADVGPVRGDERKVKQIVLNLLTNAVKFTPDGGWVGLSAARNDGEIQVAVRDTGIGIAPEDQERIFDEFQQVGRDPDRSREGTGLGLTLAKRFVELHGGRIWVESQPGKGSTFTFAIPVAQTAPAKAKV